MMLGMLTAKRGKRKATQIHGQGDKQRGDDCAQISKNLLFVGRVIPADAVAIGCH